MLIMAIMAAIMAIIIVIIMIIIIMVSIIVIGDHGDHGIHGHHGHCDHNGHHNYQYPHLPQLQHKGFQSLLTRVTSEKSLKQEWVTITLLLERLVKMNNLKLQQNLNPIFLLSLKHVLHFRMVLGKLGPGQLGPNCPVFQGGQLGPGAQLSGAQFSALKKGTVGPRTVRPWSNV